MQPETRIGGPGRGSTHRPTYATRGRARVAVHAMAQRHPPARDASSPCLTGTDPHRTVCVGEPPEVCGDCGLAGKGRGRGCHPRRRPPTPGVPLRFNEANGDVRQNRKCLRVPSGKRGTCTATMGRGGAPLIDGGIHWPKVMTRAERHVLFLFCSGGDTSISSSRVQSNTPSPHTSSRTHAHTPTQQTHVHVRAQVRARTRRQTRAATTAPGWRSACAAPAHTPLPFGTGRDGVGTR